MACRARRAPRPRAGGSCPRARRRDPLRALGRANTSPSRPCSALCRRRRRGCSPAIRGEEGHCSRRRARRRESSSPSSSSSITNWSPRVATARSAASSSSCVRQMKTPLPAASPSALTTHGARATDIVSANGTPAARMTSLAKLFDPSICAAAALGPNTATPPRRSWSATPADERCLGADDDEVGVNRPRELEQALAVLGPGRVALPDPGDARVPRSGVDLLHRRALRELPGKRVLPPAGADDENSHAAKPTGECYLVQLRTASTPRGESTRSREAPVPMRQTSTPSSRSTNST